MGLDMNVRGLLLDVEGVLVADKRYTAVPGAVEFIRRVRQAGLPLRLITNNTTDDQPTLISKLTRAGYDFTLTELHTCTSAAVKHLRELNARRLLVLGNPALQRIFADAGCDVADDSHVDAIVVGLDTEFTYDKLARACDAVAAHKAAFIALHRNRLFPDAEGRAAPSVGALVAAIEYATQTEPTVIGKPSPAYYQQALDELDLPPGEVLVVSDDPCSDLAGAKRMGMQAAFVLSGKYRDEAVLNSIPVGERPDLTIPAIGDLLTSGTLALPYP